MQLFDDYASAVSSAPECGVALSANRLAATGFRLVNTYYSSDRHNLRSRLMTDLQDAAHKLALLCRDAGLDFAEVARNGLALSRTSLRLANLAACGEALTEAADAMANMLKAAGWLAATEQGQSPGQNAAARTSLSMELTDVFACLCACAELRTNLLDNFGQVKSAPDDGMLSVLQLSLGRITSDMHRA